MARTSPTKSTRTLVAGTVTLAAAGLAGVALTAPVAHAATESTYGCTIPNLIDDPSQLQLPVALDTDAPDTALPGPVPGKKVTGAFTIPDNLADLLVNAVGAATVNATVDGTLGNGTAQVGYHVEKTQIATQATAFTVPFEAPLSPDIVVTGTEPNVLTQQPFTLKVDLFKADGTPGDLPTVTLHCSPGAEAAPVDTIKVANYSCTALGSIPVALQIAQSSTLPSSAPAGSSLPANLKADVVLGPDLAGLMAMFGVATVDAQASGTVTGTDGPHTWSFEQKGLSVPASGVTVGVDAALSPAVSVAKAGRYQLSSGNLELKVTTYNADGTPHGLGTLAIPCTPVGGPQVISTLTGTLKASTLRLVASPAATTAGSRTTVKATVAGVGGVPTGPVSFAWPGGSRTVNLTGGTASLVVPTPAVGKLSVTATYTGSQVFAAAKASVSVAVSAVRTTTKVTAKGKRGKVAKATVRVSPAATGAVSIKVTGLLKKTVKGTVKNGALTVKLGKLKKKGKLTVVATFAGSATHARSVSKKFVLKVK